MYYIYILYSESSDKYYIGYTDNPALRLKRHNESKILSYTSKHRPWEMKASYEVGESKSDAVKIERYIKKQKSRVLIEN